ncbi:unnamed protein product [Leptidea sinapis]|uniref:Uncharacterized protein n=1 Tax=Leptidea sinapis TaxID=189913 RepID=A0A5E4PPE0_9NEOP|nr:unnamed protein product [Leptidea sinapis]
MCCNAEAEDVTVHGQRIDSVAEYVYLGQVISLERSGQNRIHKINKITNTYPPTQRSINQRLQTVRQNSQQYYRQQYPNPNNVFRPKHQYFKQNERQKPIQNFANETEDVPMRTAPQLRPGPINLGR